MCNISITSLVLSSDGTQLTVTGTSDCSNLKVTVKPYTQGRSTTVTGGNWSVTYTAADMNPNYPLSSLREVCGKEVKIDAVCEDNPDCQISTAHVLDCPKDDPDGDCCSMICCMVFKLLVLLGFGLAILGGILIFCPGGICNSETMDHIGFSLRAWGVVLMIIGLAFWLVLCRPKKCDWIAFFWQAFVLAGWLMIYAGFCPECLRMLYLGLAVFVVGMLIYFWWLKTCKVGTCRRLSEWAGLFLIPINVLLGLEAILMHCSTYTRTGPYIIIALAVLFEAWLLMMLRKNRCIKC